MSLLTALKDAWRNRDKMGNSNKTRELAAFLPPALEIQEAPSNPLAKWLGRSLMLLFTIAVVWACIGEINIVAVAEGKIISSGRTKDIQPLEKGVVKAIYVKEGQRVKAGQPLVELDQTITVADQTRLANELRLVTLNHRREQSLLKALQAEGEAPSLLMDPQQTLTPLEKRRQSQLLQQQWLDYQSRASTHLSQTKEREAALQSNQAQLKKLQQTLPLITRRAEGLKKLVAKSLAPEMDYLAVEQERIEQQQTLASHQAQHQQHQAAIETTRQQLNTLQAEVIGKSLSDLDEYQRQIQTFTQELAKATELNANQILYAPVDGTIQQLAVHTIGGVVTEAQILMKLVPRGDVLEVEAILENKDIGFVFEGQSAEIKVNTFSFTKYGIIDAEVVGVTADAMIDEAKGLVYKLRLKLQKSEMRVDGRSVSLLPGMAVSAEVKTGKRRLIEFVMAPLMRYSNESARER